MKGEELQLFVNQLSRVEFESDPIVYSKAIRVTLIALGYDETWVNTDFREFLEKNYDFLFEKIRYGSH